MIVESEGEGEAKRALSHLFHSKLYINKIKLILSFQAKIVHTSLPIYWKVAANRSWLDTVEKI